MPLAAQKRTVPIQGLCRNLRRHSDISLSDKWEKDLIFFPLRSLAPMLSAKDLEMPDLLLLLSGRTSLRCLGDAF